MTISGWVLWGLAAALFIFMLILFCNNEYSAIRKVVATFIVVAILAGLFGLGYWICNYTAAGRRAMLDQKSNLNNGVDRTVTVYTANGDIIAKYHGKIDIDSNDGGYIKFDFGGKRYIYYNCFVESITD